MKISLVAAVLASFSAMVFAGASADPGATAFKPDGDGFIENWVVLEPIRLTNLQHTEEAIRAIVASEDLQAPLTALAKPDDKVVAGGGNCLWYARTTKDYLLDLTAFASEIHKPTLSVIFYGIVYITAPEEMKDARLAIGSDDDSIWWLNGKEVVSAFGVRQTSTDDNVSKRLTLNKGVNVLRFAVIQGDGPSGACARFYDSRQKPVTQLSISLVPPAELVK
jgi:hypothetical protein